MELCIELIKSGEIMLESLLKSRNYTEKFGKIKLFLQAHEECVVFEKNWLSNTVYFRC